jgi:hypothetical protein
MGGKSAAATGTGPALGSVLSGAQSMTAAGATKGAALSGMAAWLGGGVTVGVGVALVVQTMSAAPPPMELPRHAPSTAPVTTAAATATTKTTETETETETEAHAHKPPPVAGTAAEPAGQPAPAGSGIVERLAPETTPMAAEPPPRVRELATVTPRVREDANVPFSLEQEARALAEVQRALRDGRVSEALALLAEQDRRYRSGALGAERAAARALALCASGRFAEARPIGERFSREHARSPLADRVRRNCLDPNANAPQSAKGSK